MKKIKVEKMLENVGSDDELAAELIMVAVMEFIKRTGRPPQENEDVGSSEFTLGLWFAEMREAKALEEGGSNGNH